MSEGAENMVKNNVRVFSVLTELTFSWKETKMNI